MIRRRTIPVITLLLLELSAPAVSESPTPVVEPSPSMGPVSPSLVPNDQWGPLAVVHDPASGSLDAGP